MATLNRLSPKRDVIYSCGSCGYELNLHSSNRNTNNIDCKYRKAIRRGTVSFVAIDESRFSETGEIGCVPRFAGSNHLFRLFGRRTRLNCRKCGSFIGIACDEGTATAGSKCEKYEIRISALLPSSNPDMS